MYTDDSILQVVSKNIRTIELKLTDAFAKIVMKLNKLTVLIGSYKGVPKNTNVTVKYENQMLEQISSAKLLRIHIDSNLTWQDQYNYICKTISQNIAILKRI